MHRSRSVSSWALVAPLAVAAALAPFAAAQDRVRPELMELPPSSPAARASGMGQSVASARRSVVHVRVEVEGPRGAFAIERPSSGVVLAGGVIVTHKSLVEEAVGGDGAAVEDKRLLVQVEGGDPLPAEFLGYGEGLGVAFLRCDALADRAVALSSSVAVGDPVVVVSHHDGKDIVAFGGVWTPALGATTVGGRTVGADRFALTDAKIQQRNHGGGLFDLQGRLLGLVSAEHVLAPVREPDLKALKQPTFGLVLPAVQLAKAYASLGGPKLAVESKVAPVSGGARAVAAVAPSVVGIWAGTGPVPELGLKDPHGRMRQPGCGSGVVVSSTGLVVTNAHLVANERAILVIDADGQEFSAEMVDVKVRSNMALLRVALPEGVTWQAAPLGSPTGMRPGSALMAIGRPGGRGLAVTAGVLSAHRGRGILQGDPSLTNQTAGGAIVDGLGRLVGIADGGILDPIDIAFARRGDAAPVETDLHRFPGSDAIARMFGDHLGGVVPAPLSAEQAEALAGDRNPLAGVASALLNVYVSRATNAAAMSDNPFASHAELEVLPNSLGSGVIIDGTGLALSNWHVVDAATNPDGSATADHTVHARSGDGAEFDVQVLSISREDDLALLQLVRKDGAGSDPFPFVRLGDSDAMALGEQVFAVGNPHGNANTVTSGVLSAVNQEINIKGRWAKFKGLHEPDAAINGGNSGGALLDTDGMLVGINSAGSNGFSASGYAIPVNYVRQQLRKLLLSPAKLRSPWLGLAAAEDGEGGAGKGIAIAEVDPSGPAAAAGVRVGDRLVEVAGAPVHSSAELAVQLLKVPVDVPVELKLDRGDGSVTVTASLWSESVWAVWKQSGLRLEAVSRATETQLIVDASTAAHRRFTGDPRAMPSRWPDQVVRVVELAPSFDRDEADVQPGDVIIGVNLMRETRDGTGDVLQRFESAEDVKVCFNDQHLGSYEGTLFRLWIFRDGGVHLADVSAKRLWL